MNLDVLAREKALKTLQRGFDVEAYLVLGIAESRIGKADRVPESTIDENISSMADEFVKYMNAKAKYRNGTIPKEQLLISLEAFLNYISKITTELFNSCDFIEEKEKIKNTYQNINSNLK